jgi:hypothetical protein
MQINNRLKTDRTSLIIFVLIALVFILSLSTIIQYFTAQLNEKNSEISSLESQISSLKKPDLVTSLGISERLSNYTYDENDPKTYNHLLIEGTVTNMGLGTALNAGLHVEAISITGQLVINMTVPIVAGSYGLGGNLGQSELYNLESKGVGNAQIAIYHKSVVTTWNVTTVYDNLN